MRRNYVNVELRDRNDELFVLFKSLCNGKTPAMENQKKRDV